jgi:hypothetical protein
MAYVFRGELVAELRYVHELESPDQIKASSARVVPVIAREMGEKLPGERALPASVQKLPEAHRIASGISYEYRDLLGVSGAGRGALGFYKNGEQRYRIFASLRPDEDSAKDVIKTLRKVESAKAIKDSPIDAVILNVHESEGSPKVEWLVGRTGSLVAGVGDDAFAAAAARSGAAKTPLSDSERQNLLRSVLSGSKGAAAPAPSAL